VIPGNSRRRPDRPKQSWVPTVEQDLQVVVSARRCARNLVLWNGNVFDIDNLSWSLLLLAHVVSVTVCVKTSGGPNGHAVPAENFEPAADQPHPQHSAEPAQQAAVAAARDGEGRRRLSEFPSGRSHSENQGSDAVS